MDSRDIAVIGAGAAGLSAAWLLSRRHRVTLFEAGAAPGGHVRTVDLDTPDGPVAVDTGFIVYNAPNYPNLTALFSHLGVPSHPTTMSFAVSFGGGAYEYSGSGLAGFFGQPANLACAGHWQLLAEILRFLRTKSDWDESPASLGEFLDHHGYSRRFAERHLLPMGAAIWSTRMERMLAFPAGSFLRFYRNHGLLRMFGRPRWRTVTGGARTYVRKLLEDGDVVLRLSCPVRRILRRPEGVIVELPGGVAGRFDDVVVATHADTARRLLADADPLEDSLLGAFHYQRNRAVLHSDPAFMPRRRRLWSSWNYLGIGARDEELCVTYWMNELQGLETRTPLFVTLNPPPGMAPRDVHAHSIYDHPVFDVAACAAREDLWRLQGRRHTWFCGAHFGDGFHEDAMQAGLAVAEELGGVRRPWRVSGQSARLRMGKSSPPFVEAAE